MKSLLFQEPPIGRHHRHRDCYYQILPTRPERLKIVYKPFRDRLGGIRPHTFYKAFLERQGDVDDLPLNVTTRDFPPDLAEADDILRALARYRVQFKPSVLRGERRRLRKAYNNCLRSAGQDVFRW